MINAQLSTDGIVLHSPVLYDVTVWLAMAGREQSFRQKLLNLAGVQQGQTVLDVGCGTGTLAIAAKRRVGPNGAVFGVDASREMLVRADKKARDSGEIVSFQNALAEALPFPDGKFDIVFSIAMLHHLPLETRTKCTSEIRRILKPGGRLLAVDFEAFSNGKRTLFSHFHRPHSQVMASDVAGLLSQVGLRMEQRGEVGIRDLWYILASPC